MMFSEVKRMRDASGTEGKYKPSKTTKAFENIK